jgi:hypothetical protein
MDEMGGSIVFYRQFVERDEYEVFVVTDREDFSTDLFPWIRYRLPQILRRLQRTRLAKYVHDLVHFTSGLRIPNDIKTAAQQFNPDLVMIGAETPIADLGISLSKKLKVPLVGHFMDWPTFAIGGHSWISSYASKRFRERYRACDLAFGICPEMLERLGPHPNAHVFYPSGKFPDFIASPRVKAPNEPCHMLFAGNLGQWYGRMVLQLAQAIPSHKNLKFSIAGKNANWTSEEETWLIKNKIFAGFKKGAEYEKLFESADCLLVCMGFDKEAELIESTSFKSKFVDYLRSGKPIVVWGPEYCTAVRHARKYGFAACVTDSNPCSVVEAASRLLRDSERCERQITKALKFFKEKNDCEIVFSKALSEKKKLFLKNEDLF